MFSRGDNGFWLVRTSPYTSFERIGAIPDERFTDDNLYSASLYFDLVAADTKIKYVD